MNCIRYYKPSKDDLKHTEGYDFIICKHYVILYKGVETLFIPLDCEYREMTLLLLILEDTRLLFWLKEVWILSQTS